MTNRKSTIVLWCFGFISSMPSAFRRAHIFEVQLFIKWQSPSTSLTVYSPWIFFMSLNKLVQLHGCLVAGRVGLCLLHVSFCLTTLLRYFAVALIFSYHHCINKHQTIHLRQIFLVHSHQIQRGS